MSKQENRVLVRMGARLLSEEEVKFVTGAFVTLTKCTIGVDGKVDGDTHEC
jgi:hypothetical protein